MLHKLLLGSWIGQCVIVDLRTNLTGSFSTLKEPSTGSTNATARQVLMCRDHRGHRQSLVYNSTPAPGPLLAGSSLASRGKSKSAFRNWPKQTGQTIINLDRWRYESHNSIATYQPYYRCPRNTLCAWARFLLQRAARDYPPLGGRTETIAPPELPRPGSAEMSSAIIVDITGV